MIKLLSVVMTGLMCLCLAQAPADGGYRHMRGHRHHVKLKQHRHHSKMRKVASVAAPIAVGAAFGPAGSIGYQAVKHRKAIKHAVAGHHRGSRS